VEDQATNETKAPRSAVGASDATDGEEPGDGERTRAYLEQVRREIDEEVRRRRAAGDFPPSFERKLDELFARFTPTGTADDHFAEALKLADRSSYFDIDVPRGSRRRPKGFVKWSLWQAEAWFVRYVVTQMNHFAASSMRVAHLLDERLSDLERKMQTLVPPPLAREDVVAAGADPMPFAELLVERLASHKSKGRVLHGECGDGTLLEALGKANIDAYGVDPGSEASDRAVTAGLDVRRDDLLGHVGSIADDRLSGLVLSGFVDRSSLPERRRLLQLAELKLEPGATVAVVGSVPEAWERAVGAVVVDLAPGRPLHAETWSYLLRQQGFGDFDERLGPVGESGRPESFVVLARKRTADARFPE
jgi:hypothetical protein